MAKKRAPEKAKSKVPKTKANPLDNLRDAITGARAQATAYALEDDRVLGLVTRVMSTRSIAVDKISRCGGFPHGRVVELSGLNGTGKTTLVLQAIAEVQAAGGVAGFHDAEAKLDKIYARRLGVKTDDLAMIEPVSRTLEALIEATHRVLLRWVEQKLEGTPLMLVWDGVASTVPAAVMEDGSKSPGQQAKILKEAMRTLTAALAKANALLLVTNQLYEKIGGGGFGHGPKRVTSGGEGLRYQATQRYELIRIGTLKDRADNPVGIEVLVKATKNHVSDAEGSPLAHLEHLEERMVVQRGMGTNNAWSIFERLKEARYITQAGNGWRFQVAGGRAVQWTGGWQGLTDLLGKDVDLFKEMARVYMGLP